MWEGISIFFAVSKGIRPGNWVRPNMYEQIMGQFSFFYLIPCKLSPIHTKNILHTI